LVLARRQALPSRRIDGARDLFRRAGDRRLALPGAEVMAGIDTEHIALAGAPQHHLDMADAIDAVGGNPGERHACRNCALDHPDGERGLGREGRVVRHMRRRHADRIVRPGLRQIQRPVDEGMAVARHIGGEHADLAVGDLPRGAGVLRLTPQDARPCLRKPVSSITRTASSAARCSTT
jgi:hypothetical protein